MSVLEFQKYAFIIRFLRPFITLEVYLMFFLSPGTYKRSSGLASGAKGRGAWETLLLLQRTSNSSALKHWERQLSARRWASGEERWWERSEEFGPMSQFRKNLLWYSYEQAALFLHIGQRRKPRQPRTWSTRPSKFVVKVFFFITVVYMHWRWWIHVSLSGTCPVWALTFLHPRNFGQTRVVGYPVMHSVYTGAVLLSKMLIPDPPLSVHIHVRTWISHFLCRRYANSTASREPRNCLLLLLIQERIEALAI